MADSTFIVNRDYSCRNSLSSSYQSSSYNRLSDASKRESILIWLDAHCNETNPDYQISLKELQYVSDNIDTFVDPDVCIHFLTEITDQSKKIILIIGGMFAKQVVPVIEDCSQINSILLFHNDICQYKEWSKQYLKVKGVFTNISSLIKCLEKIIDPDFYKMIEIIGPSNIDCDHLNSSFMYSQLLKEILLALHGEGATDRSSFIEYCYQHSSEKTKIENFDRNYKEDFPIYWYSVHPFVFETLNRALRTVNIDLLIKMIFFVGDLHKQIEKLHAEIQQKEPLIVYRGQGLTKNECKKLEDSIGGFISFNCFLSTSTTQTVSHEFADINNYIEGCNGVLFEIKIDPHISSSPFALITEYSHFRSENEILFSTHTIFRIDHVTLENDGLYHVNLSLINNHDENLCKLIAHQRKELEGRTTIHRLAQLLYRMGKFTKAKEIYQRLLGVAISLDDIFYINHYLARIDCHMGEFGEALSKHSLSLQFNDGQNLSLTADVYAGMGEAFLRHDMLEDSLECYAKALQIAERSQTISDHNKVSYLNSIGFVLKLQKHYDKAKIYFQRALDIALARFPETHPDIANLYQNIGSLYYDMDDFHSSIYYLNKSLDIQKLSLPSDHPYLGNIYYNLSKTFVELNQIDSAIHHGQLAVDILEKTLPDDHFEVCQAHAHLDALSVSQRWMRSSDTLKHDRLAHLIEKMVIKMYNEKK